MTTYSFTLIFGTKILCEYYIPPNAIKIDDITALITVILPGNTKPPKFANAYIFNDADNINGINVVQAYGNVEPPTDCLHLKLKVAL